MTGNEIKKMQSDSMLVRTTMGFYIDAIRSYYCRYANKLPENIKPMINDALGGMIETENEMNKVKGFVGAFDPAIQRLNAIETGLFILNNICQSLDRIYMYTSGSLGEKRLESLDNAIQALDDVCVKLKAFKEAEMQLMEMTKEE